MKLNFISKKKINRLLSQAEEKYASYVDIVQTNEQLSELKMSGNSTNNLDSITKLKSQLKSITYCESLNEDPETFSIMPELLNKKYLLKKGDSYE